MKHWLSASRARVVLVAVVVGVIVGGGYAVAASGGGKQIKACVHKHGRGFYARPCHKGDKKLRWNKVGPRGPTGKRGPKGNKGDKGDKGNTGPQGPGAHGFVAHAGTGTTSSDFGTPTMRLKCISGSPPEAQLIAVGPSVLGFFLSYYSSYAGDNAADGAVPDAGNELTAHGSASSSGTPVASTYTNGGTPTYTHANGTVLFHSGRFVINPPSASSAQTYAVSFELTVTTACSAAVQITPSS